MRTRIDGWWIECHGLKATPKMVEIDGTRMTLTFETTAWLPRDLHESTLHFGDKQVTKPISNRVHVGYGQTVTLIQEVEMTLL